LDSLEKAIGYFNNVYSKHFSTICNGIALLTDHAKALTAASDALVVDCNRVQIMMQVRISFSERQQLLIFKNILDGARRK
jgi:hypothetical protein